MPVSTMMPDIQVYIAFPNGYLDTIASRTYTDVSAFVEAASPITITRGRQDELTDVEPSRLTITLDNRDGRFTPGNTSSPYYPNVLKGRPIVVNATWASIGYSRFTGYIDEWPVVWPDGSSAWSTVTITASSRQARMAHGAELRSMAQEEIMLDGPVAYYPLGEPDTATSAGNISNTAQPKLTRVGTGTQVTFGTSTGPGADSAPAPTFGSGKYLAMTSTANLTQNGTTHDVEIEASFIYTGGSDRTAIPIVVLQNNLSNPTRWLALYIDLTNGKLTAELWQPALSTNPLVAQSTNVVDDGATHHGAVRLAYSGSTCTMTLYRDGVLSSTVSSTGAATSTSMAVLTVGGSEIRQLTAPGGTPGPTDGVVDTHIGSISHVAVFVDGTPLTTTRIANHFAGVYSGFAGETPGDRISRLALYAGVPAAEMVVHIGTTSSVIAQDTTGQTVVGELLKVVHTDAGMLFDGANGQFVYYDRDLRWSKTSAFTLNATQQQVEANLEAKLDDQHLINDVTISRPNEADVRGVDVASVAEYGPYRQALDYLTTVDSEVQDAVNWLVSRYSTPLVRISAVEVDLLNQDTTLKAALLATELGDRMTISNLPTQAPASSMSFFVEGITETIGAESHTIGFNLSPAELFDVWTLDSSAYSVLGSTTVLAY